LALEDDVRYRVRFSKYIRLREIDFEAGGLTKLNEN